MEKDTKYKITIAVLISLICISKIGFAICSDAHRRGKEKLREEIYNEVNKDGTYLFDYDVGNQTIRTILIHPTIACNVCQNQLNQEAGGE